MQPADYPGSRDLTGSKLASTSILASSRTVDTIAAGTLAMMDMTGLRSSIMKIVARRFDKNL